MGAFYGSVYFRTENRDTVRSILEEVARKRGCRFLLGPALRGWVAAYPEMHGQDERVAKAAAKPFAGEALYVLVHDSDIFAYTYFRDGKVVDEYNSCPDYFGEAAPRARARTRGRPERLAHLLAPGKTVADLEQLLCPEKAGGTLFADDLLQTFADLLGLPNALTSYDYLKAGESDGTEGWDQFLHVPDDTAEKARKREAAANLQRVKGWMQGENLLLLEQSFGESDYVPMPPAWCPDREGNGFLVGWPRLGRNLPATPLRHIAPPWTEAPDTGLVLNGPHDLLVPSPSGRYLIAGCSPDRAEVPVWDLESRAVVAKVAQPGGPAWAGFSPDERLLVTLCHSVDARIGRVAFSFQVAEVLSGRPVASFQVEQPHSAAVHPSGVIVVADALGRLTLVDLASGQVGKTLHVGGVQAVHPGYQAMLTQALQRFQQTDPQALKQEIEAKIGKQAKAMEEVLRKRGAIPGIADTEELIRRIREQTEKAVTQMKQMAEQGGQAGPGPFAPPSQGKERVACLACSADGRFVFCATNEGVRVYDWEGFQAATESTPPPVFTAEAEAVSVEIGYGMTSAHRNIYTLAHDAGGNRLLFGGLDGRVRYLDLATGRGGTFLDPPGRPAIQRLGLSRDRSALCCTCQPDPLAREKRRPALLQVWNYAALDKRLAVDQSLRLFNP